jgi:plasmid maintenance system antidote protein VapI
MAASKAHKTMTELLREALAEADSVRAVAKATGLEHASLARFVNGEQSLRLDLADKLAAHLGIECRRVRRRKG